MGDEDEDEEVVLERWGLKGMSKEEVIALGDDVSGMLVAEVGDV